MNQDLNAQLTTFCSAHNFLSKGSLSVALHVTRYAIENGLPVNIDSLKTDKKGQVKGLSKSRIQSILSDYGILKILAAEGGRTSRGSLDNMEQYANFLNQLERDSPKTLQAIETWWVQKVIEFFASKPLRFEYDRSKSLSFSIRDLLHQAMERQKKLSGMTYLGTVLQHLVGAKLELALQKQNIAIHHHGAAVADEPTGREGDFVIQSSVIHVTVRPSLSLLQKCRANLARGYHPIIITLSEETKTAQVLAVEEKISERIEIFAAEDFLAANLHELSGFSLDKHAVTIEQMIEHYNQIIDKCETDPSLRIAFE